MLVRLVLLVLLVPLVLSDRRVLRVLLVPRVRRDLRVTLVPRALLVRPALRVRGDRSAPPARRDLKDLRELLVVLDLRVNPAQVV